MGDAISLNESKKIITKRMRIDYSLEQENIMKIEKKIIILQLEKLKMTGKSVIYENQEIIASRLVTAFKDRRIINIMVVSKTQSGKTGSMCATIKKYLEDSDNLIPINNIYIITGLSSCEWKEQTKERMPESIQQRVFHRNDLPKIFANEIKDKKNILIIMDEIQVAAKNKQTIYKSFKNAGLLDKKYLYENDIKILEYTATPDGTIYDLMEWKDASYKILADVGDGYIGCYDLLQMGRVKQFKNLCCYDIKETLIELIKKEILKETDEGSVEGSVEKSLKIDCEKIVHFIRDKVIDDMKYNNEFDINIFDNFVQTNGFEKYNSILNANKIEEIYSDIKDIFENIQEIKADTDKYNNPLYHVIRTKNGDDQELTIEDIKHIFGQNSYNFIKYDRESKIKNINTILEKNPEKHTFIFIKELLRCSKTLTKNFIGILYDRYTHKPNDSTIIQGLVGRDTGYDNNKLSICYTNIRSIEKYEKLWNSGFEDKSVEWNSNTTKNSNGELSGKNTFNDPKEYDGFSETSEDSIEPNNDKEHKVFNLQEDAIQFAKETLGVNFYYRKSPEAPGSLLVNGKNPSVSYLIERMWGIGEKNRVRMYPTCDGRWCVYWRPSLIKK